MDKAREREIKQKFNAEHYSRVHSDLPKDLVARFKTEVNAGRNDSGGLAASNQGVLERRKVTQTQKSIIINLDNI